MSQSTDPKHWFQLGKERARSGALDDALVAYRKAVELDPDYAEAWSNLGRVLGMLGRVNDEIDAYRRGAAANPALAPIWSNLGEALRRRKELAEAEAACRTAIERDAGFIPAYLNLGNILRDLHRHDEALGAFRMALASAPDLGEAWLGIGNVLQDQRQYAQAAAAFERACAAGLPEAHLNTGLALKRQGRHADAEARFRRALELDRNFADAAWALSLLLLALGRFEEGWHHYEARWSRSGAPVRRYPYVGPLHRARPKSGRALVWGEQGVGDELLYCSLAAGLATDALSVTLEADARLAPLFARSMPGIEVIPRREPPLDIRGFDYVVPAADLGAWLRPSLEAFPAAPSLLKAEPNRVEIIRRALKEGSTGGDRRIGLAWRSRNAENSAEKSVPLSEWLPILSQPGASFVDLQYGDNRAEREALASRGAWLEHIPQLDLFNDLDGLAALIAGCDLVITTSNVTAHLAGHLGRPVWVLLPRGQARLWYWMDGRDSTPWYPSARLFSQEEEGEWRLPLAQIADALRAWLAS
jgi:Tfp pilus assembly protein PilF